MEDKIVSSILREKAVQRLVGHSAPFVELIEMLQRIADLDISVLLTGETGTGKTKCAEFIHNYSCNRNAPLIVCNCGALPETLFESQIFGHVRGAFTGAYQDRDGLVVEAHNGTLVLDEINSLSLASQVKLNHFLERGQYRRIGENKIRTSKVRIISITNKDLKQEVSKGSFREDLYYRLNEYEITVPPLRFRTPDIPDLFEYFVAKFSYLSRVKTITLSTKCMDKCFSYAWPGNIREFEFFVKRLLINTSSPTVSAIDLPEIKNLTLELDIEFLNSLEWKIAKKRIVERFEKSYVSSLLRKYDGNVSRCAKPAGMYSSDFWRLMRKYNIKAEAFK